MHVVIMGCGRVGSTIATGLESRGHSVAVVDQDATAFRRLPRDFGGRQVVGVGFDRDTLIEAGIEQAGGFAAVSSGDNSNIISARVARETFGIDNVVARIYDPRRAEVYSRLGIPTVATVRWTADEMMRRLLPEGAHSLWSDPTGHLLLLEVAYDIGWVGRSVREIGLATESARVAFLTRYGEAFVPKGDTALQDGDQLHIFVTRGDIERTEQFLAAPPPSEHA
ncbi:MAG TPA: TrkA family potassium uptake protein [Mycobacteriales bacterium]|nr:TrkA family potassium uptake protein [Mycobacteriales bacterium]